MIYLTDEQHLKIELLDTLFNSLNSEQLKQLTESEQIVSKLKGNYESIGILKSLITDYGALNSKISAMESTVFTVQNDIGVLIKAINKPHDGFSRQEFDYLKNKYSVF